MAVACLGEVATLDDDHGVGVVGRWTGAAVILDTLRDVTERGAELPVRRLFDSVVDVAVG